jgi:hypothetical protein
LTIRFEVDPLKRWVTLYQAIYRACLKDWKVETVPFLDEFWAKVQISNDVFGLLVCLSPGHDERGLHEPAIVPPVVEEDPLTVCRFARAPLGDKSTEGANVVTPENQAT